MVHFNKQIAVAAMSGMVLFVFQASAVQAQRRGLPTGVTAIQGAIAPGYSAVPGVPFTVGFAASNPSMTGNGASTGYSYISGYRFGTGPSGPDVVSTWVSANGFTGPNQGLSTNPNLGYFGTPTAVASRANGALSAPLAQGTGTTIFGSSFAPLAGSPAFFGGLQLNNTGTTLFSPSAGFPGSVPAMPLNAGWRPPFPLPSSSGERINGQP